jgi:hypothetical protein
LPDLEVADDASAVDEIHATIAITLDIYSHAIPQMQEDAAEKIAALLERYQAPTTPAWLSGHLPIDEEKRI